MQILILVASLIIILLMFGFPLLPIITGLLWCMWLLCTLSCLFFLIMAILLFFTKKKEADYLCLEDGERAGSFATYEVEGEACRNIFPTDAFLERIFYRKQKVHVRVLAFKNKKVVFDKLTVFIISLGLPAFFIFSFLLAVLTR